MVPAWTLFALTAIFFVREVYKNYTEKNRINLHYKYFDDTQKKEYQMAIFMHIKKLVIYGTTI